jgi:hypothetical protein
MDVVDIDMEGTSDTYLYSYMPPAENAPVGLYAIEIYIDEASDPVAVIVFTATDNA